MEENKILHDFLNVLDIYVNVHSHAVCRGINSCC